MGNTDEMTLRGLASGALNDRHVVQFYGSDERPLVANVARYLLEGFEAGEGAIVIASAEHRVAFLRELEGLGGDPGTAERTGQLACLDAIDCMNGFVDEGEPNWERFEARLGDVIRRIRGASRFQTIRAYGEMVGILWREGQISAAIRLEQFWNRLLDYRTSRLFCAYPIDIFKEEFEIRNVDPVLCAHTQLVPSGANEALERAINQAIDDVLEEKARLLRPLMQANFRPTWASVPRAEALALWLRNNLPEHAEKILVRGRQLYAASRAVA